MLSFRVPLVYLNIGSPKIIHFPFVPNGKPRATRGVEIGGCFALVAGGQDPHYTMQPSVIPCHRIYNSKQFIPNPIYRKNSNIMQTDPTRIMK